MCLCVGPTESESKIRVDDDDDGGWGRRGCKIYYIIVFKIKFIIYVYIKIIFSQTGE